MNQRLFLFLLVLPACGPEISVKETERVLTVTPAFEDLGDVAVGTTETFSLRLDNVKGADITIRSVDVQNLMGECFTFTGKPPLVPEGGSAELPFEYTPDADGYHWAQVTIVSDASDSTVVVDLRAHASIASLVIWPPNLDFGNVAPDDSKTLELTVANGSAIDVTLEGASTDNAAFVSDSTWPIEVAGGLFVTLPITFTAASVDPSTGTLTVDAGGVPLSTVPLGANDCESADPVWYDQDHDGYASCYGDCLDTDASVHPGAREVANGLDDDCDGLTDEDTDAWDDDRDGVTEGDGDCNDSDPSIYPGAKEILGNGIDDDCDGVVDAGTSDGDGDGYSIEGGDCDDADPGVHPGVEETADAADDDCDGIVDEGTEVSDDDGDGYTEVDGDCDDGNYFTHPGATETANGVDDDCDGHIDEATSRADDDHDGYTEEGGDCNDANGGVHPGAAEIAGDGLDNNCDGVYT